MLAYKFTQPLVTFAVFFLICMGSLYIKPWQAALLAIFISIFYTFGTNPKIIEIEAGVHAFYFNAPNRAFNADLRVAARPLYG